VALAPSRSDATGGSALDCDLARREDARHGGRATPGFCSRDHRRRVTVGNADLRERACRPGGGRRARQGFRPRGRDIAAAPESDSGPSLPRLVVLVVPRLSHAFPLDDFAHSCPASGSWPGRWRAGGAPLKAVEKVVTGQDR
jgi:hypothetical protein